MSLRDDILKLLAEEGYRINESVRDALDEFIEVVEEEIEGLDDELGGDEDEDDED